MMLYIFPYHIISDLFSECSKEVPLLPKVASPKFLFRLGKFFENCTARDTLNYSNYFGNRIPGWKRNQEMSMVLCYFTAVYFKIKMAGDLFKELLHPCANSFNQNFFPVFRTPDQMILRFINRMARSFQAHAGILKGKPPFLKPCRKYPARL